MTTLWSYHTTNNFVLQKMSMLSPSNIHFKSLYKELSPDVEWAYTCSISINIKKNEANTGQKNYWSMQGRIRIVSGFGFLSSSPPAPPPYVFLNSYLKLHRYEYWGELIALFGFLHYCSYHRFTRFHFIVCHYLYVLYCHIFTTIISIVYIDSWSAITSTV